jgi:hypothetical protein
MHNVESGVTNHENKFGLRRIERAPHSATRFDVLDDWLDKDRWCVVFVFFV